ncbi:importin subunit alpha-4-like isoform X2 [Trifolium pratense]|uniref:importin subunit alpha-4-like isoform X2 n=1 Tax=Trifolium pratense TaxID=57577 RepID=UPI001E693599|nr:importin subunit alpha-4-like isoform X2 [Trifolium pratense]
MNRSTHRYSFCYNNNCTETWTLRKVIMSLQHDTQRKKGYKSTGRRRREDVIFIVRKNKRQDSLSKRRKLVRQDISSPLIDDSPPSTIYIPNHDVLVSQLQTIRTMTLTLLSDNPAAQLEATTQFGTLLSKGYIPLIDKVIRAGVVPRFVKFLTREDMPQLQFMAAWTLTNIAAGLSEHTRIVIDHGAVPLLVQLMSSSNDDIKEQTLWALGNIAGDSPSASDHVLNDGALLPLLSLLWNPSTTKKSIWNIAKWAFLNLCRGKSLPTLYEQIRPALPALRELLLMHDEEFVLYACQILSCITQNGSSEMVQAVVEANVCPRLVELLLFPTSKVIVPALQILGDIASGDDAQTQVLINSGALHCLKFLLTQSDKIILEETCLAISNITAGNSAQLQAVLDADLITPLVCLTKAEFNVRNEAVWAISNATHGTPEQIRSLACKGCIEALCDLLISTDPSILTVCLNGLRNILKAGEINKQKGLYNNGVNIYAQMVEECGGLDKIVSLQSYDNNDIYKKAVEVLEKYFPEDLETVDEENHRSNVDGTLQQ